MVSALRSLGGLPRSEKYVRYDDRTLQALRDRGLTRVGGSGFWELSDRGRVVVEDELQAVAG
jgi:hypothetical protein